MATDLLIFVIFLSLASVFYYIEKHTTFKSKVCAVGAKWMCVAASILAHPLTWGSLHEFMVHLFVYSGKIPLHF